MTVLITGATGLVGKAIVAQCAKKDIAVHYLTTSKNKLENQAHYKGFYWNPAKGEIDMACFEGVDAIINLAGASISKRWTKSYKETILKSRISSLNLLRERISENNFTIKHLISASAIGIYPDSLTRYYDEDVKEVSPSFLGTVTEQWEAAADAFSELGMKVTKIRIGLVLGHNEGALPKLVQPVRYGMGATFGDGSQWQSWIHVKDLARLFLFVLINKESGIFNGVAPNPVTNKEMLHIIAKDLHKPLIMPNIPKSFMKLVLGDMHQLLFESQLVCSKKVEALGFSFKYPKLEMALRDLL
ncbi:TIGR01777 family oxidoreductase [Mangrovimonas xylaniphaga]|uniref:TIGR01777 family oxidoreductase n=1 Tax=Mangrovimonas xylaniphaga TaxID=1645915 RepID=UPI0006B511D6|nr:TIGR01777 family oxidoreductase [Mangrovimonas xylaniphaga]